VYIYYKGGDVCEYTIGGGDIYCTLCAQKPAFQPGSQNGHGSRQAILTWQKKAKKSSKHKLFTLSITLAYN